MSIRFLTFLSSILILSLREVYLKIEFPLKSISTKSTGLDKWLKYTITEDNVIQSEGKNDIPLFNNNFDQMIVTVSLGTPPQNFDVLIDTGSEVLWVAGTNCLDDGCREIKQKFDIKGSSTLDYPLGRYAIEYVTGSTEGYLGSDFASINGYNKLKLLFLIASRVSDSHSVGIIGFDHNPTKNSFSYLMQLYLNNVISKRIISQQYKESNTGVLTIGDYPDEIANLKEPEKLGFCSLDKESMFWVCNIETVFSQSNYKSQYRIKDSVVLDTGSNQSLLKQNLFRVLISFFSEFEYCGVMQNYSFVNFVCDYEDDFLSGLPYINFKLDSFWIISQSPSQYFKRIETTGGFTVLNFQFITTTQAGQIDENIFGENVLKYFISIFNKENEKFEFYGKNMHYYNGETDYADPLPDGPFKKFNSRFRFSKGLIILICVSSFILLVLIGVCFYCYCKKKRSSHQFQQSML